MTQKEFDEKMMALNAEQRAMIQPIKERMDEINITKKQIKINIAQMRADIERLTIEYMTLESQRKQINCEYHDRKHALAVEAPPKAFCPLMIDRPD